jgi:hypothetical protein
MFPLWLALLGGSFVFLDMGPSILFFVLRFVFYVSKWVMWTYFRHLRSKSFPTIQGNFQSNGFLTLIIDFWRFENLSNSNSQSGSSLGHVEVHSFRLSHIPGSIKCDSQASFLAHTFASPCFGCNPKTRVATKYFYYLETCHFKK